MGLPQPLPPHGGLTPQSQPSAQSPGAGGSLESLPPDTVATRAPRGSSLHAQLLVKPTAPLLSCASFSASRARRCGHRHILSALWQSLKRPKGPPWRLFWVLLTSGSPRSLLVSDEGRGFSPPPPGSLPVSIPKALPWKA